jgi:hypothetical protein
MVKTPDWKLDEDRKSVTVTFPTDPPVALQLDVSSVDEILKNLGEFRELMKPEIPPEYSLGQKVAAIPDPAWRTEPDALMGNSILHIRDPRFGWLHYMIPRGEARKLAGFLQEQAERPPPGQGSGKTH